MSSLPRLLLLTDRAQLRLGRSLVTTIEECVHVGLTHVVLRELDLSQPRREALAAALAQTGVTVIAAHRPLRSAVGVHLPADATGPGVGLSCHTREQVAIAAQRGFAYTTLGPFGPSVSKPGYGPPLPADTLAGHTLPVYALGGVTVDNAAGLIRAGAHGVAVMGTVMRDEEPASVVRRLLAVTG